MMKRRMLQINEEIAKELDRLKFPRDESWNSLFTEILKYLNEKEMDRMKLHKISENMTKEELMERFL